MFPSYIQQSPFEVQVLVSFVLRPPIFEIQGCRQLEKSEMQLMASQEPWRLKTEKFVHALSIYP